MKVVNSMKNDEDYGIEDVANAVANGVVRR